MGLVDDHTLLALEIGFGQRGAFIFSACNFYVEEFVVGGLGIPLVLAFEKTSGSLEFELTRDRRCCVRDSETLGGIFCGQHWWVIGR